MKQLKVQIAGLSVTQIGSQLHLPYQAVTDTLAAFLFSDLQILETADSLCRESGYTEVVKLTPPDV